MSSRSTPQILSGSGALLVLFCCILRCSLSELYLGLYSPVTVLFVSISQVIGCEDRLRNDLDCVG